jgi:hypothetical protein
MDLGPESCGAVQPSGEYSSVNAAVRLSVAASSTAAMATPAANSAGTTHAAQAENLATMAPALSGGSHRLICHKGHRAPNQKATTTR